MDAVDRLQGIILAAQAAIRLLASETGRTRDGKPLAVSGKNYHREVSAAKRKQEDGQELDEREAILAAAPRRWWIDQVADGYPAMCRAAGVAPAYAGKPSHATEMNEAPPRLPPIYKAIEDYHPPLPPLARQEGDYYDTAARRRVPEREITVLDANGRPLPPPQDDPQAWLAQLPAVVTVRVTTTERWAIR
jgi:hypothetical protein